MSQPTSPTQKHFRINTHEKLSYRASQDGTLDHVEGHAAVFNTFSPPLWELGGARECIMPGAFTKALATPDDVKLLINHDASLLLARNVSGTLQLKEDATGLWFSATLPNTSYANDLRESMARGDISQCSFAFCIEDASMDMVNGEPVQMVRSVTLSDVSIVTYPAYPQTDASLRSHYQGLIESLNLLNKSEGSSTSAMDCHASRNREIEILRLND